MGEGARVDELTITPSLCVALEVDSRDLRAGSTAIARTADALERAHHHLLGVIQALDAATGLPDALAALPARARVDMAAVRLQGAITRIRGLSSELRAAATNYEANEGAAARLWSGFTHAGGAWHNLYGTWIPSPRRLLTVPLSSLTTKASRAHRSAQMRTSPRSRWGWMGLGSTVLLSSVAYSGQLSALSTQGWVQYYRDLHTAGRLLPTALTPILELDHPGIDRARGAELARALAGIAHPGGDVEDGARIVSDAVGLTHWALGHQGIRMAPPTRRSHEEPVRTFAGAVAVMEELEVDGNTDPGSLRIDRITSSEGETAWQVFIPGGQGFDPSNVHALLHAPAAVASQPTPSVAMVAAALRDAGAVKGEPIVMVGHSHGGITGSLFASDPRLRAEFDVPLVVAAGSPIDEHEIRSDTHVLAIEHTEDVIPGTEGVEHQIKPGLTRVERTLADSHDPQTAAGSGIHHAHDYPNYVRTAELVDAHPDLQHMRDYYAAIIPEGQVETFVYRAEIG